MTRSVDGTYLALAAVAAMAVAASTRRGSVASAGVGEEAEPAAEQSRQVVIESILDSVELHGRERRIYRRQLEAMTLRDLAEVYDTVHEITQEVDLP